MRTLLIDNHDSFTYNLVHYLRETGGTDPVVVRNDEPGWHSGRLAEFDNVVISPGPGTPRKHADFGICREVIRRTGLPLLGVCLGHQGIALLHGGTVDRAPEPRHGRLSPVLHDGTELFAGIPSPFEAVRYHSLTVTDLPEQLEPTARTPDGVLMGLRHRTRPMWGVQFHPESVATRHGHQLLCNFADLTRRHREVAPREAVTVRSRVPQPAPEPRFQVLVRRVALGCSDETAFDRLFRGRDHAFWLDSSRPDDGAGRFSVMGDATGPLARVVRADVWSGTVTVRESSGAERVLTERFFDWLEREQREAPPVRVPDLPFDFALGWVGYLGYELKAECGGEAVHRSEEPDAVLVHADRALVVDHTDGTGYLLALAGTGSRGGPARDWLELTAERLRALAGATAGPPPDTRAIGMETDRGTGPGIRLRHDRETYLKLIDACQEEIAAGESYEICLTNRITARAAPDPWQSYRALRRISPAPFGALLQFGEVSVLSTSPERFLRVGRDGRVESRPIKGTRPRGADPAEDAAIRAELRTSEKDRAENLMIVDLVRNDLARECTAGSVQVTGLFEVETYATVHQLVSTVQARLRPDSSAVRCVRAAFPGGSMTGAPKIRSMQIIDWLEAGPRGVYSGAVGYLSHSGAADFSMVIRTAVLTPGRVGYGVGGAIVALSDPQAEFQETVVKAAPLLRLLGTDFPGE
jgi:para-aminobenzoate synthetase